MTDERNCTPCVYGKKIRHMRVDGGNCLINITFEGHNPNLLECFDVRDVITCLHGNALVLHPIHRQRREADQAEQVLSYSE